MSVPASGNELTSRASMSPRSLTISLRPSCGGRRLRAEVEPAQPRHALGLAAGDLVERVLHAGGELVVDQVREVPLEQVTTANATNEGTSAVPFLNT